MKKPVKKVKAVKSPVKEDASTEEKIKEAARKVFTRKGFAATRTRDISEEAGINLALLNYYFRSKEKLFEMIMVENVQHFLSGIKEILNNETTTLNQKITAIVENYINLLKSQPHLPLFILHEMKLNPENLIATIGIKEILHGSSFMKQLQQAAAGKINPIQIFINILSLTVFPFIAHPIVTAAGNLTQNYFDELMEERKKLIPQWIELMIKMKSK